VKIISSYLIYYTWRKCMPNWGFTWYQTLLDTADVTLYTNKICFFICLLYAK